MITTIGIVGAILILVAFLMNQINRWKNDDLSQEQGGGQIPDFGSRCMSIGYMNDLAKIFQYNWGDGDQLPYSDPSYVDEQVGLYILMMKTMEGFEDTNLPDVVYERKGAGAVTDANAVIQQQRAQIDMQAAEIARLSTIIEGLIRHNVALSIETSS